MTCMPYTGMHVWPGVVAATKAAMSVRTKPFHSYATGAALAAFAEAYLTTNSPDSERLGSGLGEKQGFVAFINSVTLRGSPRFSHREKLLMIRWVVSMDNLSPRMWGLVRCCMFVHAWVVVVCVSVCVCAALQCLK